MKIATTIIAILIGVVSVAAGTAKVMLVPEEAKFMAQFGFFDALTITFGIAQVIGGLLLVIPGTRIYGAVTTGIFFTISFIMVASTGNFAFATVSLLPILLAGFVIFQSIKTQSSASEADA